MFTGLLEWAALRSFTRCCTKAWDAVIARINAKRDIGLERTWNEGTATAIATLPPGAELEERSPGGGHRHLRVPAAPPAPVPAPGRAPSPPGASPGVLPGERPASAPQTAIEPAPVRRELGS